MQSTSHTTGILTHFRSLCLCLLLTAGTAAHAAPSGGQTQTGWEARTQANVGNVRTWQGNWKKDGLDLPIEIFIAPETSWGQPEASGRPVAIYLANMPLPRVGTASDEQIRHDLLAQGFAVVSVDVSSLPAQSPEFEETFAVFHKDFQNALNSILGKDPSAPKLSTDDRNARITTSEVFVVPTGYTVSRTVPFWNIEKHGKEGSLKRIVDVHNDKVVSKFKRTPVTSAHEIQNRKDQPLDFNLYLDIVHPAGVKPGEEVPTILNFSTHSMRLRTIRPGAGSGRMLYALGFAADGYAWVAVDHPYIPLARHQHFDYFEPYTLENQNSLAVATAAVRYLNAHSKEYGLNGHFGAMGHSKASFSVAQLLDPNHPTNKEHSQFKDFPDRSPEEQPWQGESSQIDVGYVSMGLGVMRTQYFNPQTKPLITAVGRSDQYGQWKHFPRMVDAAIKNKLNYVDLWMEDRGHDYPNGADKERGMDRYALVKHFFDQILHPHNRTDLEVLYTYPRNGATGVATDGTSRVLPADDLLPENMRDSIPRTQPVSVRFARPIDTATIAANATLTQDGQSTPVAGTWETDFQDSGLLFTPASPLRSNTAYILTVKPGLRDTQGNTLKEAVNVRFTTAP